jgi:mannose-6-phosphate isomerase-like protein (cupin superfamily)
MSDVTVKKVGEIGYYQGPGEIPGIKFRHAAKDLGVTAWGMNVLELGPNVLGYPEHDHAKDGQEEVYAVLEGSATLHSGDRTWPLEKGAMVRVDPSVKRKIVPGATGATILAIGGTPGSAFKPRS